MERSGRSEARARPRRSQDRRNRASSRLSLCRDGACGCTQLARIGSSDHRRTRYPAIDGLCRRHVARGHVPRVVARKTDIRVRMSGASDDFGGRMRLPRRMAETRVAKKGLPALAVGWGAIEDLGILTRMDNVKDSLSGRVGVTPIKARAALDQLGQVLAGPASALEDGVVFIAPMNRGKARDFCRACVRRPSPISRAARPHSAAAAGGRAARQAARRDRARSLMGVELAISIEERFALQGSLTASATGLTIAELGDQIVGGNGDGEHLGNCDRRRASSRQGGCRSPRQSRRTHRSAARRPVRRCGSGAAFTMPCARSRRGGA